MAIDFNLGTTVQFITILSPFFLAFFMLLISLFNKNVKGFIYLGGVLLGSFIWKLFNGLFTNHLDSSTTPSPGLCSLIPSITGSVSYNSYFICFTMIYVFLPMFITNQTNWGLIIFFLSLFCSDAYFSIQSGCYKDGWGPAIGAIIGIICGIMWFELFYQTQLSELLYFNDLTSNKESCSRPQKQNFKCSVFKDGKLVGTM
jgi:hypothetical protein